MTKPVCFFDLETTGRNQSTDRIVEIAIVKISEGVEEEFVSLVNPEMPIPIEASNIHGITDDKVATAPKLSEIVSHIIGMITSSDLAGYNSNSYDIPLLVNELRRVECNIDLSEVVFFDASTIFKRNEGRSLTDAVKFYTGGEHEGAHGAMADVRATIEVFKAQRKRYLELPTTRKELALYCNYDKPRADLAGKFAFDAEGEYILNFGAHKYKKAKSEPDYLRWMLTKDFAPDTVSIIKSILVQLSPSKL